MLWEHKAATAATPLASESTHVIGGMAGGAEDDIGPSKSLVRLRRRWADRHRLMVAKKEGQAPSACPSARTARQRRMLHASAHRWECRPLHR